ncbi:hypothetical protein BU24DRAFT_212707 [Aaosphaeria arxii CBS 175.79]|uniref:Rho termination factor N-terminal domain-containing protein n=1 Tax=Aaosphaeria arxii CBS 175.79 TaxID=1450172 RepID=A0A6A5XMZ4_9PLEO|nr:uncharacterized protein BU24DRAFT_212707 [Aaosphaeria arxii CBS 175.79]KAF2014293.1 hypothetical protein BU24DRAFT_212707 [Aaosphaeria arxii CBS 175.79]
MSASWLQRKRKGELLDLAREANVPDAEGLLKDDLVEALQNHLGANESTYGKQPSFSEFYRRGSPVKRERSSPTDALVATKPARRRTIVKAADSEEPTPEKALVTRTPRTVSRVPSRISQVDIPASPAQLAEVADQSFQAAKTKASELWDKTRIEEFVELARENASSVVFIQLAILTIEGIGLEWNTLKSIWAFDIPAVPALSLNTHNVYLPDLQLLLTSDFWAPATLWSLTSWVLPLLVSYFFNLTLRSNTRHKSSTRQYTIDPLTFNIVRAVLAYSAYHIPTTNPGVVGNPGPVAGSTPGWGPFAEGTVRTVRENVPGEYAGLQIASFIGVLLSIYDAALKK